MDQLILSPPIVSALARTEVLHFNMGKSRKHKTYEFDDEFEIQNKRMKNAIRTNDVYALQQYEDEDFF